MRLFQDPDELNELESPLVLAVGNFDGLHLGHLRVIQAAVHQASRIPGGKSGVMTFHPHPLRILRPHIAPASLLGTGQRTGLLKTTGIDFCLELPFSPSFAEQEPEEFVVRLAAPPRSIRRMVTGEDWRFGRGRTGDIHLLRRLGQRLGFAVEVIPTFTLSRTPVKSTAVRGALQAGRLALCHRLLGRPYRVAGEVHRGRQLGRQLGMPTANLIWENDLMPPPGVYLVSARRENSPSQRWTGGVANLGFRPTVGPSTSLQPVLEVHLFEPPGELYGERMEVGFLVQLRLEKKFSGLEELSRQLERDREEALRLHSVFQGQGARALWSTAGITI